MTALKTYQYINDKNPSIQFGLVQMEAIFDAAEGLVDKPHRHDYYTVLFVKSATGRHIIDYNSYDLGTEQIFFVSPGQVHQVITIDRPKGWVITFSKDFLASNNISEEFISNINLFRQFGENPPLTIESTTSKRLLRIIEDIKECIPLELTYRRTALGALLQLFLIHANNSCSIDTSQLDEENSQICLLRDFKQLVEAHHHQWHKVSDYANEINITPKHLSQTVKSLVGKTAKAFIQDRLTLEAKRLLLHTDLSIKSIAYELGFEEPLHFSGFFKKQSGVSPSAFRQGTS